MYRLANGRVQAENFAKHGIQVRQPIDQLFVSRIVARELDKLSTEPVLLIRVATQLDQCPSETDFRVVSSVQRKE